MPVIGLAELREHLHPAGLEEFREVVALLRPHRIVLVDVIPSVVFIMGQEEIRQAGKCFPVSLGNGLAPLDPLGQVPELGVEERRLHVVEQAGEPVAVVLPGLAVLAVEPHPRGKECHCRVVRGDGPSVAVAAQDLEGVEAPAPGQAPCTRHPSFTRTLVEHARSQALTGILHNQQVVLFRNVHDANHVGHVAAQVYGDDPPGPGRDGLLDQVAVDVEVLPHIDKHRGGSCIHHSGAGGHKGVGRHDHLVPGPDACGPQGQMEGVVPAVQPHGILCTNELRQVLLESPQL